MELFRKKPAVQSRFVVPENMRYEPQPELPLLDRKRGDCMAEIKDHMVAVDACDANIAHHEKCIVEEQMRKANLLLAIESEKAKEKVLQGPIAERVGRLLSEEISFDPDPTGATDALIDAEIANGRMPPELSVVGKEDAA